MADILGRATQAITKAFGMTVPETEPPVILLEAHISSLTLSKSGTPPFTITLRARNDSSKPITIDASGTVLWSRATALAYQGLTFTDTETGELAERITIDVQYQPSDKPTANFDHVVTIPPKDAVEPYKVSHTFRTRRQCALARPSAGESEMIKFPDGSSVDAEELLASVTDHTAGFTTGHSYEIGLGSDMSEVSWWVEGIRAQVFAHGPRSRRAREARLRVQLMNTARFEAAE